jgi:hypothetical protein
VPVSDGFHAIPKVEFAHEFAALALTAAICASLLNACEVGRMSEGAVASLLPIFLTNSDGASSGRYAAERLGLVEFGQRIQFAQSMTRGWLQTRKNDAVIIDLAITTEAWRNGCSSGTDLGSRLRNGEDDLSVADALWFDLHISMLDEASRGNSPCLDETSKISVPGWAGRRTAVRHQCAVDVWLRIDGEEIPAIMRDISVTGAGLQLSRELPCAKHLAVCHNDRSLLAEVKWSAGNRLGVAWTHQLDLTDPLLGKN